MGLCSPTLAGTPQGWGTQVGAGCGFPPCRQREVDRMGHGPMIRRSERLDGFVLSHPCGYAARMGHPSWCGLRFPTLSTERSRQDGARADDSAVRETGWVCALPPLRVRRKDGAPKLVRVAVSHPVDREKSTGWGTGR